MENAEQPGSPGTLLRMGLSCHLTEAGQFGLRGLDELLLPKLRIENLELLSSLKSTSRGNRWFLKSTLIQAEWERLLRVVRFPSLA